MRRVEPQRRFSQKTVQLTALSWLRLTGMGFRTFPPIPSQSAPEASSSVFLTEDDIRPSNQLGAQQLVVPKYMSTLAQPEGLRRLPEVALPLSKMKMQTAYDLLRTLWQFCCANPGVLDFTSALVQLPPVGNARSPYRLSLLGRFRSYH